MKEVDKALADQKVSGRRIVIEEVEGSEDEDSAADTGTGLSNGVEDHHAPDVPNNADTDTCPAPEVLVDETKDETCVDESCHSGRGGGDADGDGTAATNQPQATTAKGDATSPDDDLPPAVLALKDAGNELFRKGQYGDALDKYNAAVELLGQYC